MIHAYDEVYLDKAKTCLGRMLDYGVNEIGYSLNAFWEMFLNSGFAQRFGDGDYALIVGMSGVELARAVLEEEGKPIPREAVSYPLGRSEEYWTGWAIAHYQWYTGLSFEAISKIHPITRIRELYYPYHEMDIRQFVERMNELSLNSNPNTRLKTLRLNAGLTQAELAQLAEIPLRTLQQYEQRQKNINKAQVEYLAKLAKTLHTSIETLLEPNAE